jgi:SAM-dependent methyltransferase
VSSTERSLGTSVGAGEARERGAGGPAILDRLTNRSLPVEEQLELVVTCGSCGSALQEDIDPAAWVRACVDCGHVFHSPRPTAAAVRAFQGRTGKYDAWIRDLAARRRCWLRRVRTLRRFVRGGRLLDVGAGIGEFLHHASRFFDIEGVEIAGEAIARAEELFGVRLQRGTLTKLEDSEAGTFDVVSWIHVLEHVHEPLRELERCRQLLRPDGWLYVCVPNDSPIGRFRRRNGPLCTWRRLLRLGASGFSRRDALPFESVDLARAALDDEIHLSHFTPSTLGALLERSGFRVVAVGADPAEPGGRARALLDRLDERAWRIARAVFGVVGDRDVHVVARCEDRRRCSTDPLSRAAPHGTSRPGFAGRT